MAHVTRTLFSGLLALGLAACASSNSGDSAAAPDKPAPPAADDKCKASLVTDLVGQPYDAAMLTKIQGIVGHKNIRPIRPNQPVTMDFREDRLNIDIDKDEKIARFHCS